MLSTAAFILCDVEIRDTGTPNEKGGHHESIYRANKRQAVSFRQLQW